MHNPHKVTADFESALCAYTGSKYAVATNSCTSALLLAVAWHLRNAQYADREISIPKRTYVGVAMSVVHAGGIPVFRDSEWSGAYQLKPYPVIDSARRFFGDMYIRGTMTCVSFHASKILADTQGGAILHDDDEADAWLRRSRFDGRTEGVAPADDTFDTLGWHCYLSPDVAARLLWKLSVLPERNLDLPNDPYPDLSLHKAFQ